MGYKSNDYIIENDVDEIENQSFEKRMKTVAEINNELPEGYEIEEEKPHVVSIQEEIQAEAEKEGLVSDQEYLGGKGASPKEVIKAMREEGLSQGAKEKEEEHNKKRVKEFKTITATRDLLFNRAQEHISIFVPMVVKMKTPDGKIVEEPVDAEFKVKRLTEAENTHILNHKLIGKELSDMTDEEYMQSTQFRSKVLEKAVVEPHLSAKEWQNQCSNADLTAIYEEVNKVLAETDDVSLFQ